MHLRCAAAILLLGLAIDPAGVHAQADPSHVPIPSSPGDPDPAALLARQVRRAQDVSEIRELIRDVIKNPESYGLERSTITAKGLSGIDLNKREVQELIQQVIKSQPAGTKLSRLSPEELQRLREAVANIKPPSNTPQPATPPISPIPPSTPQGPQAPPEPASPSSAPGSAPLPPPTSQISPERQEAAELLREWFTRLSKNPGPWTNSPTFRRLVQDLGRLGLSMEGHGSSSGESLDAQLARFNHYAREAGDLWETGRSTLQGWNLPRLSGFHLPSGPAFSGPPSVSPPRAGVGLGTGPDSWQTSVWLLVGLVLALAVWQLWGARWARRTGNTPVEWKVGPWPVPPAEVATRADLVRAFEHLALLRCGPAVRQRHHRMIADQLGGTDPRSRRAARDLAMVYEQARYAPVEDPLTASALEAARRDLCFLAGVGAV